MARTIQDLCESPWNLWCDRDAGWRGDRLYLPADVDLATMPHNPPTIGWDRLFGKTGVEDDVRVVELPATVEQYFWGHFGLRPYQPSEYFFAGVDHAVLNGSYLGVSWWWRKFTVPANIAGQRLVLKFRGARLRAEVYLNEQLVGYNLINETPFEAEVTQTLKPGAENTLAVRITNPGGRLDWGDFSSEDVVGIPMPELTWGSYHLPLSHGFGGLDAGICLAATDALRIEDVFARNRPQQNEVTFQVTVVNGRPGAALADLTLAVYPKGEPEQCVWRHQARDVQLAPGETTLNYPAAVPEALAWSLDAPQLYTAQVDLREATATDTVRQDFGFRWFEVRGLGERAHFYLNQRRIVLRSAISWHYWPLSGLFPTTFLATQEIRAAKTLGLNMLNFHRNLGNPVVLDRQDELGLLRYEEPGDGHAAQSDDPFKRAYEIEKIRRMVLRDRNHPSLVMYVVMNEIMDLPPTDARYRAVMNLVHQLDPSRIVVLKSAFSGGYDLPPFDRCSFGDAFCLPYDDAYYHDDGSHWCGWWDQHTVGGPGVYRDDLYQDPEHFSHRSDNAREVVLWGEAMGSGSADNLQAMRDYYAAHPGSGGYAKRDHDELFSAYDDFLKEKGFRDAFPDVASLTQSIGDRSYYFWGRLMENFRISDFNDALMISGWESNPIENHCGLVDIFRNFKGDPALVSAYTRPLHLAVKSRHLVLSTGQALVTDFHLINEVNMNGVARLSVQVIDPFGDARLSTGFEVDIAGGDVYGQPLHAGLKTDCYIAPGYYLITASLWQNGLEAASGQERVFVVDWKAPLIGLHGAILEPGRNLWAYLNDQKGAGWPIYTAELEGLACVIAGDQYPGQVALEARLLDRVAEGMKLVLIADDRTVAQRWAAELAALGVVRCDGMVGAGHASFTGSWYFVKAHPLFEDLPVNTALSWEYQADPRGSYGKWLSTMDRYGADGLLLYGDNVEYVVGYTRDHDRRLGAAVAVIRHGRGEIVFSCLAGLYSSLGDGQGLHPAIARKLICNFVGARPGAH
jgi:beta-galactosidase